MPVSWVDRPRQADISISLAIIRSIHMLHSDSVTQRIIVYLDNSLNSWPKNFFARKMMCFVFVYKSHSSPWQ
jgi:hypothetical protein